MVAGPFFASKPEFPGMVMSRHRWFALLSLAMLVTFGGPPAAAADQAPPNVVVFLADDQGWGDLSLHGNPNLSTPRIDSLARQGAQLEHFYVCPVCSPTRAEFLTGRYHPRGGVFGVTSGGERLNTDAPTVADVFRRSGYATAAYGKWHNGMQWPYHPNARGFDDYYGFCSGHWGNYFSPMLEHNGAITQGNGFLVDDLTDHAIEFIDQNASKPFFVYLPYNTPHSPMQVPDPYWDRMADRPITPDPNLKNRREKPDFTRAALAMVENIDDNVGRVLDHLAKRDLSDNTIVVYFSDNGPNSVRFNGGMRGRKGSTFEGGVRSPCLIRYPQAIAPGTLVSEVTGAVDLLPTLAELAGLDWQADEPLDGHSFAGLVSGDAGNFPRDRILITHWNRKLSARSGHYRYHHSGELYDLATDPRETTDVAKQNQEVAGRLKDAIDRYVVDLNPKSSKSAVQDRPITVGHPDAIWTQVPARDGEASDGVTRSNRHHNCTFFQNWTDTHGRITWDADVLAEGDFEVSMYYAVDQKDVGSTIELAVGDETLAATIVESNETPLIGADDDRFVRVEGYVKDWKPMTLGKMHLTPGRQKMTLRATQVVGDEVAQMRLLMFRRVN